ncbi:MAG: response regulator [Elusimicrobia bacterium]|nr:MAG: response regulator [Elusimicrobiota bacterium]KAF0158463.1 MAG: response regulator [Elusimicrobiota bacterium]
MTTKKNILVVDDDQDILEQVALTMKAAGYNVATARGQEDAEEILLQFVPDLAIVDLMMEHMDSGFALCHHIKKLYPEVPVILLTAVSAATGLDFSARQEDASSWMRADILLDKPARPEQLRAEVKRLLRA